MGAAQAVCCRGRGSMSHLLQREFWQKLLAPVQPGAQNPTSGRDRFTLEELRNLYDVLAKNPVVNEANRATVVETIRSIAEFMIWGDQNEPRVFEFFLENNVMAYLHRVLLQPANRSGDVAKQVLQTLSIIIQNISSETGTYFLFSNDHVNNIIEIAFDFEHEEVLGFYISLLKAISLKLNRKTAQFFVRCDDENRIIGFPLHSAAARFAQHKEGMVRAGVRTMFLHIFAVSDPYIDTYVTQPSATHYLTNIVHNLATLIQVLDKRMQAAEGCGAQALSALDSQLADVEDMLSYSSDVLTAGHPYLAHLLAQQLWSVVIGPLLLASLMEQPSDPLQSSEFTNIRPACALYVLERIFLLVTYQPLINNVLLALFGRHSLLGGAAASGATSSCSGAAACTGVEGVVALVERPPATGGTADDMQRYSSCREGFVAAMHSSGLHAANNALRALVAVAKSSSGTSGSASAALLCALGLLPRGQVAALQAAGASAGLTGCAVCDLAAQLTAEQRQGHPLDAAGNPASRAQAGACVFVYRLVWTSVTLPVLPVPEHLQHPSDVQQAEAQAGARQEQAEMQPGEVSASTISMLPPPPQADLISLNDDMPDAYTAAPATSTSALGAAVDLPPAEPVLDGAAWRPTAETVSPHLAAVAGAPSTMRTASPRPSAQLQHASMPDLLDAAPPTILAESGNLAVPDLLDGEPPALAAVSSTAALGSQAATSVPATDDELLPPVSPGRLEHPEAAGLHSAAPTLGLVDSTGSVQDTCTTSTSGDHAASAGGSMPRLLDAELTPPAPPAAPAPPPAAPPPSAAGADTSPVAEGEREALEPADTGNHSGAVSPDPHAAAGVRTVDSAAASAEASSHVVQRPGSYLHEDLQDALLRASGDAAGQAEHQESAPIDGQVADSLSLEQSTSMPSNYDLLGLDAGGGNAEGSSGCSEETAGVGAREDSSDEQGGGISQAAAASSSAGLVSSQHVHGHEEEVKGLGAEQMSGAELATALVSGGCTSASSAPVLPPHALPEGLAEDVLDAVFALLNVPLLTVAGLWNTVHLIGQYCSTGGSVGASTAASTGIPGPLGAEHQLQLQHALDEAASRVLDEISGMWCDAIFPVICMDWAPAADAVSRPILRASAEALMVGPHLYPPRAEGSALPGSSLGAAAAAGRQNAAAVAQMMGLSTSAAAALHVYHAVQRLVAMLQLRQLLSQGKVSRQPPLPTPPEWEQRHLDYGEGQQVDLQPASAIPCIVSFQPGQERRVYFSLAGAALALVTDYVAGAPVTEDADALAAILHSSVAVVLADPAPTKLNAGIVAAASPLMGAEATVDKKVSKWVHVHVRPSVRGLLRVLRSVPGKKGGLLGAMRQLADGHWVLAFPDAERSAAACKSVRLQADQLRSLYADLLGPFIS